MKKIKLILGLVVYAGFAVAQPGTENGLNAGQVNVVQVL